MSYKAKRKLAIMIACILIFVIVLRANSTRIYYFSRYGHFYSSYDDYYYRTYHRHYHHHHILVHVKHHRNYYKHYHKHYLGSKSYTSNGAKVKVQKSITTNHNSITAHKNTTIKTNNKKIVVHKKATYKNGQTKVSTHVRTYKNVSSNARPHLSKHKSSYSSHRSSYSTHRSFSSHRSYGHRSHH